MLPLLPPQPRSTYVVQVPKDKLFRMPPPENARLFEHYTRRANRHRRCSCAHVCTWALVTLLVLAAAVGVFYIAFRPRRPEYSIYLEARRLRPCWRRQHLRRAGGRHVLVGGDTTVRTDNNANVKVGVRYDGDASFVSMSHDGVLLAKGAWPALYQYQEARNMTMFVVNAKGPGLRPWQSGYGQYRSRSGCRGARAAAARKNKDVGNAGEGAVQHDMLYYFIFPIIPSYTSSSTYGTSDDTIFNINCQI